MRDGLQEGLGVHRLVWRKSLELVIQENRHGPAVKSAAEPTAAAVGGGGAGKNPNPELSTRWAEPVQQVENYARRREEEKKNNPHNSILRY